jgi:hypothetical protein
VNRSHFLRRAVYLAVTIAAVPTIDIVYHLLRLALISQATPIGADYYF